MTEERGGTKTLPARTLPIHNLRADLTSATLSYRPCCHPGMPDFDSAHAAVCALIEDFAAHKDKYMSPAYSEAEARLGFIDKFWTSLGWDVSHITQKNPYEQEVRVEKTVTASGQQKKADYAFSLVPNFGTTLFFVESSLVPFFLLAPRAVLRKVQLTSPSPDALHGPSKRNPSRPAHVAA